MKLSQTLKAVALSGTLLSTQQGCFAPSEGNLCDIDGIPPTAAVMNNNEEVAQFCKLNRDAVITCVQTERGCSISQPATSPCTDYQNNTIIQDAVTISRAGGTFFVTCVEGTGISEDK